MTSERHREWGDVLETHRQENAAGGDYFIIIIYLFRSSKYKYKLNTCT